MLTPGQAGDSPQAKPLLEGLLSEVDAEPEALEVGAVLADKGYDSNTLLKYIDSLKAEVVIPPKKNRLDQREYSRELYKDRNKIERFIGRIKHYRRVATRYEKTARNYLAMLHLVSSLVWLL